MTAGVVRHLNRERGRNLSVLIAAIPGEAALCCPVELAAPDWSLFSPQALVRFGAFRCAKRRGAPRRPPKSRSLYRA